MVPAHSATGGLASHTPRPPEVRFCGDSDSNLAVGKLQHMGVSENSGYLILGSL